MDLKESIEYYQQSDWPKGIGIPHPDEIDRSDPSFTLPFELAPRVTEADAKKDTSTLERALQESLYLVLNQGSTWTFPNAALASDEMLGVAAQRALDEALEHSPRVFHFAKQPLGHFW